MNGEPHRINSLSLVAICALVFLLVWNLVKSNTGGSLTNPHYKPQPVAARGDLASDEKATIDVFRQSSPAVVQITSLNVRRNMLSLDVFEIPRGSGSGFVYDTEGHVVTNYHVVYGADAIEVTFADQTSYPAKIVGRAPDKDIAVLKVDAPRDKLTPLPIGQSDNLQVGQKVIAIGNPFGLDQTLTTGVVSALGRQITSVNDRRISDVIQTDAAINPGNSGGPLLDSAGRLIGVNTQIASPSGVSAGIGFAVPIDTVNQVVLEIIRFGRVTRPGLGVTTVPDVYTRRMNIVGVLLLEVSPQSAAGRAGLRGTTIANGLPSQLGDIIVQVANDRIQQQSDLLDALARFQVGDEVAVTYIRDGKERQTKVTLQALDN